MNEDDELLRPREVADLFGVRPATIARWAREGRLTPLRTPGGHRRYVRSSVREALNTDREPDRAFVEDAVRLYNEGWSIRQVAARFGLGYGAMRRILRGQVRLRARGSRARTTVDRSR
jgi:excisionase family DNA binding protein